MVGRPPVFNAGSSTNKVVGSSVCQCTFNCSHYLTSSGAPVLILPSFLVHMRPPQAPPIRIRLGPLPSSFPSYSPWLGLFSSQVVSSLSSTSVTRSAVLQALPLERSVPGSTVKLDGSTRLMKKLGSRVLTLPKLPIVSTFSHHL